MTPTSANAQTRTRRIDAAVERLRQSREQRRATKYRGTPCFFVRIEETWTAVAEA
jgi:hypothetical protein